MFDGDYLTRSQRRIKNIVDFYDHKFIYFKKVLDLGAGHGDHGGSLYRLGADVTLVDARPEHLKIAAKKFSGIKTLKADLDRDWPFKGKKFDIILSLDLLCHLRDYQQHLKDVCSSTTHLVLETAVCDSNDPNKCVILTENKGSYDLSINGVACRPSAAAIERVLDECGMNFKRVDSNKLNVAPYVYDWQPKNNDDTSVNQRRMWYCVKKDSSVQFAPPAPPPLVSSQVVGQPNYKTNQHNPRPLKAIPRPPLSVVQSIKPQSINKTKKSSIINTTAIWDKNISIIDNNSVKEKSKKFSVIMPEKTTSLITFPLMGNILPLTIGACLWFKKISSLFPNLKKDKRAVSLQGFPISNDDPSIVMCSVDNICHCNRIWIEEWSNKILTEKDIIILKNCSAIMTPSLINAQEILQVLPEANVIKIMRPWAMLNTNSIKDAYYLYFEKHQQLTEMLIESWKEEFGKLIVVGSSISLPDFAEHVSECENYQIILNYIAGARAIIDLNYNNYYKSGILDLVKAHNISIITNNTHYLDNKLTTLISQDKAIAPYPSPIDINNGITKHLNNNIISNFTINDNYNNTINDIMKDMIGT